MVVGEKDHQWKSYVAGMLVSWLGSVLVKLGLCAILRDQVDSRVFKSLGIGHLIVLLGVVTGCECSAKEIICARMWFPYLKSESLHLYVMM